jgi:hypothetical protein
MNATDILSYAFRRYKDARVLSTIARHRPAMRSFTRRMTWSIPWISGYNRMRPWLAATRMKQETNRTLPSDLSNLFTLRNTRLRIWSQDSPLRTFRAAQTHNQAMVVMLPDLRRAMNQRLQILRLMTGHSIRDFSVPTRHPLAVSHLYLLPLLKMVHNYTGSFPVEDPYPITLRIASIWHCLLQSWATTTILRFITLAVGIESC